MALLEVRDLAVEYATEGGPIRAVDGISFDLEEGHALGIIGESGSGKTSLAIALMRLLPRNARLAGGTVRLRGEDLGSLSEEDFRRRVRWSGMAMVFQGAMHALNPVVRVGDQVGERLRADGLDAGATRRRVNELLARVGLAQTVGSRYPHELSGGMKQRVMIASALTHDPPLLILDEPTSALDVSIQAQIMNLLKELKAERGMSMLFITHDLALASDLCDRLAVVYAGQIRELGSAEAVLGDPQDPYTQALLASIPSLHAPQPPSFLRGAPPDLRSAMAGCRFQPRCPLAFEPCDQAPPPLIEARPDQWARCWLHDPAWATRRQAPGAVEPMVGHTAELTPQPGAQPSAQPTEAGL
jgi:oligopeptide/dipeptide ABC transporter ATP-binding protein